MDANFLKSNYTHFAFASYKRIAEEYISFYYIHEKIQTLGMQTSCNLYSILNLQNEAIEPFFVRTISLKHKAGYFLTNVGFVLSKFHEETKLY